MDDRTTAGSLAHRGHSHGHAHGHSHGHGHGHESSGRAFALGVALNGGFVLIELLAGVLANSVALMADAAHNFSDVLGLALAWGATRLARRRPSSRHTYGLRRSTILASLANAIVLLVGVGAVSWEAIGRLRAPAAPQGTTMLAVAAAGVVINGGSALLFLRGREQDTNVRAAFLHLVADAAVSVGVLVAGGVLLLTGWTWVDPVVSLIVSAVILLGTWSLLRDALNLALDAVPVHIDAGEVRRFLAALPGVRGLHDLHIWALSTTETALTGHLVMDSNDASPAFLSEVARSLEQRFKIHHTTLQMEPPDAPEECAHAREGTLCGRTADSGG
jgi:cobalt-zinc-cadmium efflux system protein